MNFVKKVLARANLDKFSINSVATGLCETSLRGVESHGVRLLPHYVRSAILGRKNPRPNFKFKKTFPALGVLDADNGFDVNTFKDLDTVYRDIFFHEKHGFFQVATLNKFTKGGKYC